ncbi:MAG: helix-turn-helix domain-containing protein, partial [Ginsengibacter sp.]
IECFHSVGNRLFGIKFKVSPVIFQKKINFSEYREYIFPLSYLVDQNIINKVKKVVDFNERVNILTSYFRSIVQKYQGSLRPIQIVTEILEQCNATNNFTIPIQTFASKYNISTRTLQRYFEITTSISSKQALQILRIRKAANHLATSPGSFNFSLYGYYDKSHFYKHLKIFLQKGTLQNLKPHLKLLEGLHT